MKKIKFTNIATLLFCAFAIQNVFADVPLRKDDPGPGVNPNVTSMSSSMLKSKSASTSSSSIIPVTADIINSELIVDFTSIVGTATVSVVDANGYVVSQTNVDTFTTSEVAIPLDGLSSGKYSLKISYGTTKLTGNFQL